VVSNAVACLGCDLTMSLVESEGFTEYFEVCVTLVQLVRRLLTALKISASKRSDWPLGMRARRMVRLRAGRRTAD